METMIPQEDSKEAKEVIDFFKTLNSFERREFIGIVRGAKLLKDLQNKKLVNTA